MEQGMTSAYVADRDRKIWVNGEDIRAYGLRVLRLPAPQIAMRRVKQYTVPGRSGYLTVDTDAWDDTLRTAEIFFEGGNPADAARILTQARTVRFANEPGRVYDCVVTDGFDIPRMIRQWHRFSVVFRCGLAAEYLPAVLTGTEITLENETNTLGEPRIELAASGTVIITAGTETITITHVNGTLVLDSRLGLIFDDDGNAWPRTTGSLPRINQGETLVISCASEMQIKPQWRWA